MLRSEFLFKRVQPGQILDVGNLGTAASIHRELISRYPTSEVHGLDVDDQTKLGYSFAHQTIGNVEAMPYEDNFFTTVYMGEVLEHTWHPLQVLAECFRVLKPDGILILDTPNVYALSRMIRYCLLGSDVILGNPDHKIFFSRAMVSNALRKAGFDRVKTLSDSKFTIKSRTIPLPRFGTGRYLGEHLLAEGRKPRV